MRAAGRPVTRLRAAPRSTAPPMSSDDRNPQYEEYDAEFNTMREEMDASGIGASFKPLMAYEYWSRCRPSKRKSIVGNARRDNELAIDRAKKAACRCGRRVRGWQLSSRALGARPLEHPLTTRDTHDPLDRAARRFLGGARPLVGCRARDGELAHGRRHAGAALEFAGAHPRQVEAGTPRGAGTRRSTTAPSKRGPRSTRPT